MNRMLMILSIAAAPLVFGNYELRQVLRNRHPHWEAIP